MHLPTRAPGIIPAYAGSTMTATSGPVPSTDHPRIRGEHDHRGEPVVVADGSSPHTRGAREHPARVQGACGIIPAYAGSTDCCRLEAAPTADHPRIRGEHRRWSRTRISHPGSSPHTRGAQTSEIRSGSACRIIPAYAGSTPSRSSAHTPSSDHPRIRGEHLILVPHGYLPRGSSPHTRGAPILVHIPSATPRIIPAYAGSTRKTPSTPCLQRDHPRIRGEHLYMLASASERVGSSPHTRGALEMTLHKNGLVGIIPAYAGSTYDFDVWCWNSWDHPRIRGEHWRQCCRPR